MASLHLSQRGQGICRFSPGGNSDSSYLSNGVLFTDPGVTPSLPARHIAQITRSAELIALQESDERYNLVYQRPQLKPDSSPATYLYWHNYETWPQAKERYSSLHFEGGNLLFVDGHVKWRKYTSLSSSEFGLVLPGRATSDPWSKTNSTTEYEINLD